MNILLIQPPDPLAEATSAEPTLGASSAFSPPWSLMCLRGHLLERTRHVGHIIDARLFSSLERELPEAILRIPGPRVAAIHTDSSTLGQAAAAIELVKRHDPKAPTILFGEHPSQFPDQALLPRADYALAGDPEPILRNLLDCLGVEQRLHRIPGLLFEGKEDLSPYWLPNLKSLALPDWEGVFWPGYESPPPASMLRAAIRLSRGHTGEDADRAFGSRYEPLRSYPFDRVAVNIQRASIHGISEVFVSDPPGFWTEEHLYDWCIALDRARNVQPWSLQLLPALINEDLARSLYETHCRRVQFVLPSCDPAVLEAYSCNVDLKDLSDSVAMLRAFNVRTHIEFWIGGPEERAIEERRVLSYIRRAAPTTFSLQPFPFRLDAPINDTAHALQSAPALADWMDWAWDPWTVERPVPFWGGEEQARAVQRTITRIQYAVQRNPIRLLRDLAGRVVARNWIRVLEDKTSALLMHGKNKPN